MTDRDAFLAAIKAAPDDDAPRLVYADWLQENGEEKRAEFIRVQCELAYLPTPPRLRCERLTTDAVSPDIARSEYWLRWHEPRTGTAIFNVSDEVLAVKVGDVIDITGTTPDWVVTAVVTDITRHIEPREPNFVEMNLRLGDKLWAERWTDRSRENALRRRERELLGPSPCTRCDWHHPIKHWVGVQWEWRRGFVESITLTAADWLAHADAILAEHPVRQVKLTTWPAVWDTREGPQIREGPMPYGASCLETETALARRWPGIAFELPTERRQGATLSINGGPSMAITHWQVTLMPD